MAISDKKLRQVYSTLQKGGYSEDYDTFMRGFAGNENYQNRKNVYDLLKGAGADIGDTYEDFIGNLQSDNKGSGNYVYNPDGISPAEEKKEEVQPVINVENTEEEGVDDATFADYMRGIQAGMRKTQASIDRTNKAVEYGKKNLGPNVKPAKLDIADSRNVMEEEVYNPETMQMEKQYTTSYGGTYQDKFSAKQEQDKIDLKNRFDSLQRGIEKERQSVYAEVDAEIEKLQKRIDTLNAIKKDGEPKQVEGYRQQTIADLENKIADLQEKRGEFDKEAEFRANKFLYENTGMKEQVEESLQQANEALYEMNEDDKVRQAIDAVQRNSPNLVLRGASAGAEGLYDLVKRWSNPEYGKAVATQRKLSDAAKTTETALGKDNNTWMTHLLRGAWDGATDIRTWDFGINDMTDMGRLYQLQAKADRIAQKELAGEESEEKLTASEQKMLDAIALSNTLEANFSDHVPMSYRVGKSVPESAGFAAAIAANPASGLGKSIGKQAARRLIANGMTTMRYGKWGVKALSAGARVGGDALEALSTTLTTALPRTVGGVFEDMAGTAQGRYDEQGNLVFDKVIDMERNTMKAVGKGIYTNWMENQSEMVGEYFQPIGNFIRQATKNRVWMRNAVDVILGSDDAAKKSLIGKFRDRAKINGVFGEYTEEVYNNVMNAVPWGDMNMTGGVMRPNRADYKTEKEYNKAMEEWRGSVFNAETNVETFLSVTAMIFPMGAAELGGRYLNAYTTKAQLDVAIDNLNKTIGQEQASAIMNEMRNAESLQDMSKIYLTAMQDGRIKDGKQARALLDAVGRLVAYQSVNTSQANSTITEDKFERDYRNAYDAGHEMPVENKHKAGLEYERSMQELDRVLGDSFQSIASMPFEQFQRLMQTLTPEQRSVAQEYYLQSARLAGMRDASMEQADKQVQMHYNTLRRVADKNGIVYRGSSLEEGEFISPESMHIPGSRMLVVLNADNPGASRVIAREEAGEITTSEMNEELRTMQEGLRLKAQNDYLWGVMHNPRTKMPQVGETIEYDEDGSGNGKRMRVIGLNEQGQVQLLPTYIDGETMEEKVSSGEPVVMSQYEALKRQDSYYDALEAEQTAPETEGQTVITPVTEGLTDSNIETSSQTEGLTDSNIETSSQTEQTAPETDVTILTDEQGRVIDNWLNAEDDTNLVHARIDSVGDDVWSQDTKQAMHQYVDSARSQQEVTSEQAQTTDGQQTQTTDGPQTQTTDGQQTQTTELPKDEKGNVLYHKAPIETTVADLMDGSLEDDEIDAFVEANITSAQKEADKRTKDKPVMTTNKEKYLQEKAKWKENLTEAEGILAYWNTVKDAIEEKRNAVTETETEPMTEQTEVVAAPAQTEGETETAPAQTEGETESMTEQNESSNESSAEQTEGETESMTERNESSNESSAEQTEVMDETAHAQTEVVTETAPAQTEGVTESSTEQTEGVTESSTERTEGVTETAPAQTEGETESANGEKNTQKGKKRKKVKYDIYEFTNKDKERQNLHPELNGVYHDDGFAIASDSRILVADKRAYDDSKQGKVIGKDGSVIAEKYPGWRSIIPAQIRESDMDPYDMLEFLADVKKKARGMKLRLSQCNVYFTVGGKVSCFVADILDKFCRASIDLNASISFTNSKDYNRRQLFASSENGFVLAMPAMIVVDDFEGADDFFHYEKEISLGNVVDNGLRASLRAEEENAEDVLDMQPEIVEPIDDTNAEGEITPIEDMDTEEGTQDIFDRAEMLREREQAEKLLSKEIARINRMAKNARWVDSYRKDGKLSRKQIRAMENLASKLGLKIEWHETMTENGLYDTKTRTIHIALDAQNPIDSVFGHETMHKIAENEEDYEMMRNLAIEILGEEEFNRRADVAENLYKGNGYDYERAYYEQEVVCDFMGDMLHDNELLERVSWNANHRVLAAIRDVLDKIISGLGLVDENLVRVRTVVSAAYNNAIRRAEENKEDVTVEEERKASHRRKEEVDAKSRAYFEANKTGLTEQEYAEGQAMMDRMASMMNPYIDATAKGRRILPEERYGGKDAASTIFSNGSYGKSMENTLICLRTLAYNEFVNAVKRELGRPITQQESFLASQMVYDIATDPQCLYCYVSLDRKAYDEFLLRYMTQRDEVLNKFRALSEEEKNIGKKNPNEALAELYKEYLNGRKDTKEQKNRFNMWIRNEIAGIKTITTADLATSEDRENILNGLDEALAAQVKDAEKYAKSAAWAKKEVDYISYVGELLKLSKNWVNKLTSEYGLRFYSFSEYTPAFLLENMQMVRDAALRGLRGLGYTKEIDFVKVFAPTGMNINCSCYGRLDKDGNMQMDTLQGADWDEVNELRKKYKNVGAVFVATNDAAVEWALAQDWIDVVIPFHIVRTGQDIADFYGWNNYSSEQADKAKQGQRKMYISPVEHKNDKETFLDACEKHNVTPRFAKWLDNPGYMKLVNETRLSVDESVPLKPVFDMEAAEDSWTRFVNKGGYYNGWWKVDEEGLLKAIQRVVEDINAGKKANEVEYGNQKMPVNVDKMAREARKKRMHGQAPIMDVFDKYGNVIPAQEIRASVRKGTNVPEMTDEEAEIIAKAKEDGTYMKAPNGEPSNLSPRQWAQVRTKAFKEWFGDWESVAKLIDEDVRFKDIIGKTIVGYRYGKAPVGGRSFNTLTQSYESGVSMASVGYNTEVGSFAKTANEEEGKFYYIGTIAEDTGGDDEICLNNVRELTKKEYESILPKYTAISNSVANAYYNRSANLASKGYNIDLERAKVKRDAAIRGIDCSKVVDENGEPRVVYHQTNSTIFVNKKTGENYDNLSWAEKDYWNNEASEEEWDNTWEERDFYVFDNKAHGRRSVEMPAFFFSPEYDEYHEYGDRTIAAFLNLRNPIVNPDIPNRGVTDTAGEDAMNSYIEQGYDGFIREYDGEVDEINAFFPNQIKSADDNIGTFDGSNPDIRYSLRKGTDVPNWNKKYDKYLTERLKDNTGWQIWDRWVRGAKVNRAKTYLEKFISSPHTRRYRDLIPEPTIDDYFIGTETDFTTVPTEDVNATWEEMKNSGRYEHKKSPLSDSEYLVDHESGDIYRMSDHWGEVSSCHWTLDGTEGKKTEDEIIAKSNINDFKAYHNSREKRVRIGLPMEEYSDEVDQSITNYRDVLNTVEMSEVNRQRAEDALRRLEDVRQKLDEGGYTPKYGDIRFSLRTEPEPKKTKTAYAVFIAKKHKDGSVSLHPKMIAGEEVGAPPLTWLNADTGKINRDKNGNPIQNTVGRVKVLDSKNQPLAWRPGKHLAPYPNASQFAVSTKDSPTYKDKNGDERSVRDHLPDDVIFFEVEYAADKDYQLEAWEYGVNKKGKYQHSQAGLPYIPKDGYYVYRTNANPDIPAMIITGAYRINRALNDDEAKRLNIEAGGEWFDRVSGKPITDERLKELGLDEEGLKKKAQTFDYNKLDPAHDESSDAMSMPGYVRRDLNFKDENLLKAIEENQRAIPDFPGVEYYEQKYAEEKESEATDDIFSQAEEIRDNEQARASLRNNSRGVGLTYTAMQRAWDREMSRASFFAKEGYWDYLASVDEFQKLISRETGREISSMEDTYRAMLSLSSKNANDMKQFDSLLALPLQKAILKLIGATKNYDRGPGRELCDYLMAKHGIERNRDMAVRNALKEKNTDDNGLDRAAYANDLDTYYASVDKVLIDAEQNGYSWRLTEELLDQTAESYGADLSIDYSGLQGMYTDEGADEYVDYQTAKQSAIRDVEYYEAIKDKDDLEELWDAVRAISSYSLVKQSQSGLTNEDYLRDQMRRYRYFVPLRGFAEDTAEEMYDYIDADRTNGGLGSPVKTAKGHQHKSGDPIGNLLNVAYRSIASGNKNMAISHLYNLATTRDTGGILKVSKIWLENKGTKDDPDWVMATPNLTDPSTGGPEMSGEDVQAELDRFEKEMQQKKEQGLVMQVTDTSVTPPYRIEQKQHNKSHQIRVNVAGRPRVITVVGNPRLAMAMNGLLNPETSAWKGLTWFNNFLAAASTSANPSFGAANLVRDSLHSNMRMFVSESPLYWAKYTAKQRMLVGNMANWAQMLTMLRDYQKGRRPSGQRAQMFWEFMDGGGATGYTMIRNQEESIQFVKDMMKELKKGKTSKVNPMRLFDLFSYANESAELVNRFLAYETSREMGRTIERSINDAKEATLNFNRKGAGTKSLTDKRGIAYTLANALNYYSQYGRSFLIFFNAFAQGQRQLWEMAKANPGKFTMAFGVVPAVTAGIAMPMLNNVLLPAIYSMASGAGDDDEYVDYYDDLSDWERHHNLCIRAGKSWIKIPLSPELSSMYALGDVIGGAVWGKREMSASDLMVLADLLVPNNVDTSKPKVTAAAYAPSAVRPVVNVGINMDFMGRPLSKEGSYNKYYPAWRKATRSTSKSLTALSRALNTASGGSDERQGVLDVNPGYVQEMMTGLAGGYMSTTLAVSDALLPVHLAGGGTEQSFAYGAKALWDRGGVPIISRFYVPGSGERKTSRAKSQYNETVVPMMQKVQSEYSLIRSITREAKKDMVRADARLKDAQASGDTIAIAEALQGKERAEQALREAALEQETKTKELMSSGQWKAYTEMLGLTKYIDERLKAYGQGELPDDVNDAMRSAVEIAKDLDKDD